MPLHRQVEIEVKGQRFEVDEGIADLVRSVNEKGWLTFGSCESQPDAAGMAWIAYRSRRDADSFASLLRQPVVIDPGPDLIARADADDPCLQGGGVGVAFPPDEIATALEQIAGAPVEAKP